MEQNDELEELYRHLLAAQRAGRPARRLLDAVSHAADGDNPRCGDHLRVELRVEHDHILEAGFAGDCCMVCRASAWAMCGAVEGQTVMAAVAMAGRAEACLVGAEDDDFPAAELLRPLRSVPQRHRCALLPWFALRGALQGQNQVSSEDAVP